MPRVQVYLPDELYEELKRRALPASELLQAAVRAEIRRLNLLAATDAHLAELESTLTATATAAERERADIVARRVARRRPPSPTGGAGAGAGEGPRSR
ncbi:MAG: ribbon-helix-helix domain-containing protein [Acidimicrobiales bacterium]